MIDCSMLIVCLKRLEDELRGSGKVEAADYFYKKISEIEKNSDIRELKEILELIVSSGAMAQYVSFSNTEDQLFDECYGKAKQLLLSI